MLKNFVHYIIKSKEARIDCVQWALYASYVPDVVSRARAFQLDPYIHYSLS